MNLFTHGLRKYPQSEVLTSSATLGWSGVGAEVRHVPAGTLPTIELRQMEVCLALNHAPGSVVTRDGHGLHQQTVVTPGTIWLCPLGVREDEVRISASLDVLHLYLPASRFEQLSAMDGGTAAPAHAIRYLAGVDDPLIREIGGAVMSEMTSQTSAGGMLVQALAIALTARLAQAHSEYGAKNDGLPLRHGLDERRLRRVLDYIDAHLAEDISIDALATVACLSPFHFSRMFSLRMGEPPHRYVSALRLERAKAMIAAGDRSLIDIALESRFSSQANFTRAFRNATGMTPAAYRRSAR